MADHNEPKDSQRDSDEDSDNEVESTRPPAPAPSKKAAKPEASAKRRQPAAPVPAKSASVPSSTVGLLVVLAFAVGGAGGWFGHIQQAKAALKADSAAPAGSGAVAGPCGVWQDKLCTGAGGDKSSACMQAKAAVELLTPSTCEAALVSLPATLTKIKAARASCDKLVGKLCADLPPGSQTCTMVKERTPSFPPQRCDEMMKHYDEVIDELRRMAQQGGMQMSPGGPGGPGPGMPPPGMPPH